jgi:Ca2+/Na+ antiporter
MSADVAMTRKGFGEMAITATMAGPVFNVMIGGFLANLGFIISNPG